MKFAPLICAAFALIISASSLSAQCRTFVKNNCGEAMEGYVISENFNAAKLMPGDEAEMTLTFYGGEDYRLLVCHHPILKGVNFQIIDSDNQVLFDNSEKQDESTFDFRMAGTEQLTLKLKVSSENEASINPQGCVAIMIGKKVS